MLLELTNVNLAYLSVSVFVVTFSIFSRLIKDKLYIGEIVLGTIFGIAIGPYGANIFDPRDWSTNPNSLTAEVMRIGLAVGVFSIGADLPKAYLSQHWKSLCILLIPTMAWGWITCAALLYLLFPGLSGLSVLVISATLTSTDPVLALAIVEGNFAKKYISCPLRHILAAGSAANDGLAYPLLGITILLSMEPSSPAAVGKAFCINLLYEVLLGIAFGAVIGALFSWFMRYSQRKGLIDGESFAIQYVSLALLAIGITATLGSDDILSAFAAGSALSWDGHFKEQTGNTVFPSTIGFLLNCFSFVYIGAWLPFSSFNSPTLPTELWRLVVFLLLVLLLRRLPPLVFLYKFIPEITSFKQALFSAHFGPIGTGAIFMSSLALTRLPEPRNPPIDQLDLLATCMEPIVAFVVLGSILIHGLSIPLFLLSQRVQTLSKTWSISSQPEWLSMIRKHASLTPVPTQFAQADAVERGAKIPQRSMSAKEIPLQVPVIAVEVPIPRTAVVEGESVAISPRPIDHEFATVSTNDASSATSSADPDIGPANEQHE